MATERLARWESCVSTLDACATRLYVEMDMPREPLFRDRTQAGRVLAARLGTYAGRTDLLVLGLPRGGIPVAAEVARALAAPLDAFLVRKLGVPGHEELAMGAIANGDIEVLNTAVIEAYLVPPALIDATIRRERREIARRQRLYRGDRPPLDLHGKTVILVDDGLATGSTMRAAIEAIRGRSPARLVVAVPVGSPDTCAELRLRVDELVCLDEPEPFFAVGQWYEDFAQMTDAEVRRLLAGGGERDSSHLEEAGG